MQLRQIGGYTLAQKFCGRAGADWRSASNAAASAFRNSLEKVMLDEGLVPAVLEKAMQVTSADGLRDLLINSDILVPIPAIGQCAATWEVSYLLMCTGLS